MIDMYNYGQSLVAHIYGMQLHLYFPTVFRIHMSADNMHPYLWYYPPVVFPRKLTSNCIYHLSCRHMAETCHTLGLHMHVTHAQPLFSWPPRAARRSAHVILVHKKLGPFFACHLLTFTKAEPLSVLFSLFFRRFSVLFCSRDDFNSEEGAVCTAERAAHSHIVTNGAVGEADRCSVSTWRRDLISSSSRL